METGNSHIVIRGCGVISPLGYDATSSSEAYRAGKPAFTTITHSEEPTPVAALAADAEQKLKALTASDSNYRNLDKSVLMAVYCAKQAAEQAGWLHQTQTGQHQDLAVNIGSSRGATGLFERNFSAYQSSINGQVAPASSPTTTLGNVSSWAAHAVNAGGAQISHSVTCSTALMAVANGVAWLKAGLAKRFLAGGTEAPLTPFTIAQMKAVGIYSKLADSPFPCQPYSTKKQNTFILGEGAAVLALEQCLTENLLPGDVIVEGLGFGFEPIKSKTGISVDGQNFQLAMRQALGRLDPADQQIDLIITHTPGTFAGDKAELAAITAVFPKNTPALTTNKWLMGHTLGASGALSIAYALHIFKQQHFAHLPYATALPIPIPVFTIKRVMINAAGFGGNACSLILTLPQLH